MVRSKKASSTTTSDEKAEKSSSPKIAAGGVVKPNTAASSKKRTEKAISQFLSDMLPSLKKEMVKRKKEPFSWEPYLPYFKSDSGYIQTFILPLFRFLEKNEIVCTRYGLFENRHMVKTSDGFNRVMLLSRHCDSEELPADVQQYITQRFGKEWFKIPAKDGFRAKAASSAGHEGCFKVILTGLFEDSFQDVKTGETVYTINPSLTYEPCRPPPPKKERSVKKTQPSSSSLSKEEKEEIDADEEDGGNNENLVEVGAQEVPLEPLSQANSSSDGEE